MIDNKPDKAWLIFSLAALIICVLFFVLAFVLASTLISTAELSTREDIAAQIHLCSGKKGERVQVDELNENLPRYICGSTNKPGEDFHIMIYDDHDQPVWGYQMLDSEESFEIRIVDKLPPGTYRMEITGVRKTYDTIEFVILEQPR